MTVIETPCFRDVSVCACQGHPSANLVCPPGAGDGLCRDTAWAQGVQGGPCSAHTEGNDYLQCLLSPRAASPPPAVVPDPLGSAVRREGHEQAGPGNPLPSLLVCFLAKKSMILFNGSSKDCEIGLHQMETEPLGCVCMRT